jgi:hypothetical protein
MLKRLPLRPGRFMLRHFETEDVQVSDTATGRLYINTPERLMIVIDTKRPIRPKTKGTPL